MWVKGKFSLPGHPQDPNRFAASWGIDLCHRVGRDLSLQSRDDGPPKACRGPSRPSPRGDPACASDFSPHSSLLWQRVFVSQSPLSAVESGEGECGNLSRAGTREDPFGHLALGRPGTLRRGLRLPECKGPAFSLQPLAPSREVASGFCTPCPGLLRDPGYRPAPPPQGLLRNWLVRAFPGDAVYCCPSLCGVAGGSAKGTV